MLAAKGASAPSERGKEPLVGGYSFWSAKTRIPVDNRTERVLPDIFLFNFRVGLHLYTHVVSGYCGSQDLNRNEVEGSFYPLQARQVSQNTVPVNFS